MVRPLRTCASSSPLMDSQIWRQLPQELIEHILVFLPLKTFFNLRSTCKRFYSLLFSPSFISKHSSLYSLTNNTENTPSPSPSPAPFSSFLLLSHPQFQQHFPLYDSIHNHWRMLSLPLSNGSLSSLASHLVSASNGLLCLSLRSSSSFLVCNLLARSSRIISYPILPFAFESVTLIPTANGYKIFVLSSGSSLNSVYVYDSRGLHGPDSQAFSIVGFDLESGNWRDSTEELPGNGELTFARLVSNACEGKLYMIGGIGRHGISRSMKLWGLRGGETGREWMEIGSLPEMMCKKFMSICYHNYQHVYCFYHEGAICVCCYTWPEVLCYKISRQTWHWLPKCPSLPDKWSCGFKWFSFVPNLYALV
ncbi:hypothetical protein IFM89_016691 [Coptis chinensis]|uniref:F-box domain-containing protein n=1 Tax=Coptis chinensis TaxID=261450 RepID=A0A835IRY6_9MAGN|nr:hypothetical protein IFM89_016691 [Coptis chinensis]